MSITIKVDLPDSVASRAREQGLLEPTRVADLIEREVTQNEAVRGFREMVKELRACPDEPMTMDEIQDVVNEVRAERRQRGEDRR